MRLLPRIVPVLGLALAMHAGWAAAQDPAAIQFEHRGVTISGLPVPPDRDFDIDITPPEAGAKLVAEALDVLYDGSKFNADAIERLKANGNVVIIYDPGFPGDELTQITIAAFLPEFYQSDGEHKDFLSVVGRYGGKWKPRDLAPILAHELTGHGIQHLRGRTEEVRVFDLECEAYLYQEKAYQDLGFDKHTKEMVKFRQTLERHWCADFRAWQREHRPKNVASWDQLHPDVPKILDDYLDYIEDMRRSGVAAAAIERAKEAQRRRSDEVVARLSMSRDPDDLYQLALMYTRGVGVDSDPDQAAKWLIKAAEAGHARAQYDLARAFWKGDGVKQDKALSAQWTRAAAENGNIDATYNYGVMLLNGQGVQADRKEGRVWLKKAADAGLARAKQALKKLDGLAN